MHYYFHWLPLNMNSCYGGHSHRMQGVYIHHPFFIASAGSILKRHFHLIYDRKKMQWIHDIFCSMTEHAKNVNAVFVHLMCFESLISSCVTAPPHVELLQQPLFPTHTHTQKVQIDRYIYLYIKISISPNLNDQMSCSQLHFCPEWNDEDQENQGKINSTLKKMHATSGHIVYLYICNCSLDMHNTWDEWLQQKNSIFKIHSLMYFVTIYYISHVNDVCMKKKNNGEFWGMLNVTSATISSGFKSSKLSFHPC